MNDYVILIIGILFAGVGGEIFVRGLVGLAHWARIPSGIIGSTIAAFATSSPELSVSVSAALSGNPGIALGDALGSNVTNIGLILALSLLISRIHSPLDSIKRDFPIALIVPVITGFLILDGILTAIDGMILIVIFLAWLIVSSLAALKERSFSVKDNTVHKKMSIIIYSLVGFAFLVVAGQFIVSGSKGIAISLGMDEFIIGVTVVALGTSTPELATVLFAKLRGHDDLGLGTILGSNIFNGLFIVGIASIINPIPINWSDVIFVLFIGIVLVALTFPMQLGIIKRRRGIILLLVYIIYIVVILQR